MLASMTSLALLARVLLAVLLVIAGAAKLRDRTGTRETILAFGVPRSFARPLAVTLPLAELAVAGALLPDATAAWGAIGAVVLLVIFAGAIAASIARGWQPDCHCLGRLHSRPAGWSTLLRSCLLAATAGFVAWVSLTDRGSAAGWLDERSDAEIAWLAGTVALALSLGLVGWLAFAFDKRLRFMHRRLEALERTLAGSATAAPSATPPRPGPTIDAWPTEGLEPGATAPGFVLPSLHGADVSLDALRAAGRTVVLVFLDPASPPSMALLGDVTRWQQEHGDRITLAAVSRGDANPLVAPMSGGDGARVLFQRDREVAIAYRATHVPSAVAVHADGSIAAPLAVGQIAIEALISATAADGGIATRSRT